MRAQKMMEARAESITLESFRKRFLEKYFIVPDLAKKLSFSNWNRGRCL